MGKQKAKCEYPVARENPRPAAKVHRSNRLYEVGVTMKKKSEVNTLKMDNNQPIFIIKVEVG